MWRQIRGRRATTTSLANPMQETRQEEHQNHSESPADGNVSNNSNSSTTTLAEAAHAVTTALDSRLEFTYIVREHPSLGATGKVYHFQFQARTGQYRARIELRPGKVFVVITSPINIPAPKRVAVAEFLCRTNYGLVVGFWEMDMNDGEIQHKIVTRDQGIKAEEVEDLFTSSVYVVNTFFPGIMALTYADKSPEEAYRDCLAATQEQNDEPQEEQEITKPPSSLEQ